MYRTGVWRSYEWNKYSVSDSTYSALNKNKNHNEYAGVIELQSLPCLQLRCRGLKLPGLSRLPMRAIVPVFLSHVVLAKLSFILNCNGATLRTPSTTWTLILNFTDISVSSNILHMRILFGCLAPRWSLRTWNTHFRTRCEPVSLTARYKTLLRQGKIIAHSLQIALGIHLGVFLFILHSSMQNLLWEKLCFQDFVWSGHGQSLRPWNRSQGEPVIKIVATFNFPTGMKFPNCELVIFS